MYCSTRLNLKKWLKMVCDVLALVVVEENEANNEPPPIVQPILEEFMDVVQDEIPQGLPPM